MPEIPSAVYWFSGTALFLAGSFIFGVVVGLIGIREMISDRTFWSFLVVAVVLGLLAWYTAAKQERDSAELKDSINKIAGSANVDTGQSVSALADKIIEKLNSQIAPLQSRRLQPSEISKMDAAARGLCPIGTRIAVTAANGNQEAQMYASDFVRVFKAANCDSDLDLPIPGLRPDVIGLHIGVRDAQHISVGAAALAKILSAGSIKFDFAAIEPSFFPGADFVLVIGAK